MATNDDFHFENFRLDLRNECLWREQEMLSLTPKAFAILRYLAEHPGQLVTKAALLNAVWPDTAVGDAVLTVGIGELRKALADDPRAPRFIETVHRRGYRFLPAVSTTQPVISSQLSVVSSDKAATQPQQLATETRQLTTPLVGREAELAQLHAWFEKMWRGERQLVFVTGDAGSGKTALVEVFLSGIRGRGSGNSGPTLTDFRRPTPDPWIAQGQCVEHYGAGEAYLPVLDALGHLCRAPGGAEVFDALHQYAPTWLLQMPALLSPAERDRLRQQTHGATRERMLRELADAVAALSVERPLVLALEDLHWSDYATLDLLTALARRREPARLLLIGTYRPAEVLRGRHPLRAVQQELQAHQQCVALPLAGLTAVHIAAYLAARFPRHQFPAALPRVLHQRTNGNPLFLINTVKEMQTQAVIAAQGEHWDLAVEVDALGVRTPESIRQMIERQVERLSPAEQRLLEGASVAGVEFAAGAVAATLDAAPPQVEEQCEQLARQGQFLRAAGVRELPDGAVTAQYAFVHALYHETVYERIGAARRMRFHQHIGRWLEAAYGEQAVEIAAEIAVHCEQGREYERAVRHLEYAARKAMRRGASHEAMRHLRTALRLLGTVPETTERTERELTLQTLLAPALMTAKGYGAPEVAHVYARVRALSQQHEDSPQLFPVLVGVAGFHIVRAEYQTAHEIAEQLAQVARRAQDPGLLVEAHAIMGVVLFYLGEFAAARTQLEQSLALYDPHQHRSHAVQYGQDPWVVCRSFLAWALWFLGYPEQALQRSREAIAYAQDLNHPLSLAFALHIGAIVHNTRRDPQASYERAEAVIALASEHGLPYWLAQGTFARGRALVQVGQPEAGLAQIRQVARGFRREGKGAGRPAQLALLAEAYQETGQPEQGLQALAEAQTVASSGGERYWEAEVYRLKGVLLLMQ